jgi:hypothetical protein
VDISSLDSSYFSSAFCCVDILCLIAIAWFKGSSAAFFLDTFPTYTPPLLRLIGEIAYLPFRQSPRL